MSWDTSEIDDETEEDEARQGNDLDERQPEFDLAKPLDTETIDGDDESDENGNPGGTVDTLVPVSDDEGSSNDLIGTDDEVFAKVDEGGSETVSGIDTSSGVSCETLFGGEPGRHFTQSQHDRETPDRSAYGPRRLEKPDLHHTHNEVGDEQRSWTRSSERGTTTNDQTGTLNVSFMTLSHEKKTHDGTTDGNHGDLPRLQGSNGLLFSRSIAVGSDVDALGRDVLVLLVIVVVAGHRGIVRDGR